MHLRRDSRHQGLTRLLVQRNPGRTQRHHFINNLVWRAMTRAGIPSVEEPKGLTRSDGKGLTSIPWREGRSATWDIPWKHRRSFIPGHVISSRISRRKGSHPQRRKIHRNISGASLLSNSLWNHGSHQPSWSRFHFKAGTLDFFIHLRATWNLFPVPTSVRSCATFQCCFICILVRPHIIWSSSPSEAHHWSTS